MPPRQRQLDHRLTVRKHEPEAGPEETAILHILEPRLAGVGAIAQNSGPGVVRIAVLIGIIGIDNQGPVTVEPWQELRLGFDDSRDVGK